VHNLSRNPAELSHFASIACEKLADSRQNLGGSAGLLSAFDPEN
jgi:hypothetical protein